MPKAYSVAKVTVTDPDTFQIYSDAFFPTLEGTGGKLIGFSDPPEILEGEFDGTRMVLLEFPSAEALKEWHASDAYQAIVPNRHKASSTDMWLVNGFG